MVLVSTRLWRPKKMFSSDERYFLGSAFISEVVRA